MIGTIIEWIMIGAIAGWLAGLLLRGNGVGIGMDVGVGMIGGVIGGFLLGPLGIGGGFYGFNLTSPITALIGAIILLLLVRLLGGGRARMRA